MAAQKHTDNLALSGFFAALDNAVDLQEQWLAAPVEKDFCYFANPDAEWDALFCSADTGAESAEASA